MGGIIVAVVVICCKQSIVQLSSPFDSQSLSNLLFKITCRVLARLSENMPKNVLNGTWDKSCTIDLLQLFASSSIVAVVVLSVFRALDSIYIRVTIFQDQCQLNKCNGG